MGGDTIREMSRIMEQYAGNPSSVYWEGQQTAKLVQQSRERLQRPLMEVLKTFILQEAEQKVPVRLLFQLPGQESE